MRDGVQPTLCCARGRCVECRDGICNAPVSTMELGRAQLRHCPRRPGCPPSLSGGLGASNSNTPPCSLPDMRSGGQNTRAPKNALRLEVRDGSTHPVSHATPHPCSLPDMPNCCRCYLRPCIRIVDQIYRPCSLPPCNSNHVTSHVEGAMQLTMSMDIAITSRNFFSGVTL